MTTATLSVGINTSAAKKSLDELRTALGKLADAAVVDPTKFQEKIDASLSNKEFTVKLKLAQSATAIGNDLTAAFRAAATNNNAGYQLKLDVNTGVAELQGLLANSLTVRLDKSSFLLAEGATAELNAALQKTVVPINKTALKDTIVSAYKLALVEAQALVGQQIAESLKSFSLVGQTVRMSVDATFLGDSAARALKAVKKADRTIQVLPDGETLMLALETVLLHPYEVNIDEADLALKVSRAIKLGASKPHEANISGVQSGVKAAAFDPAVLSSTLISTLSSTLTPIIDRMAMSVADAMKSVQASKKPAKASGGTEDTDGEKVPLPINYSLSKSARTADGSTIRSSQKLDADVASMKLTELADAAEAAAREAAWDKAQAQAARQAKTRADMNAVWARAELDQAKALASSKSELESQHTSSLKEQIKGRLAASKAAQDSGLSQAASYFAREKEIQAAAQRAQKDSISSGKSEVAEKRAQELAKELAWTKIAKQQAIDMDAVWARAELDQAKNLASSKTKLDKDYTDRLKDQIRSRVQASKAAQAEGLSQASSYFAREKEIQVQAQRDQKESISGGKSEVAERRAQEMAKQAAWEKISKQQAVNMDAVWARAELDRAREHAAAKANLERQHTALVKQEAQARTQAVKAGESIDLKRATDYFAHVRATRAAAEAEFQQFLKGYQNQPQYKPRPLENAVATRLPGESGVAGQVMRAQEVKASTEAMRAWNAVANDSHSFARGLAGSLGMLWVTWGSTIPLVAAAALGGAIRSVFKDGKDLEYQLKFVQALSGGVAVSLTEFADAVRGSLVTPVEAAGAMRAMAQNGLSLRDSLASLPGVLALATAGEMSLTEAALAATGVMSAFDLQVGSLGRIGDVFAKAAAISNTSVKGMAEAMKQASTVGDQYHLTIEQTAASLAILAKRNIEGSAAGTAIRNMLTELATPTVKAREALKTMGVELFTSSGQLKDYEVLLKTLGERLVTVNEKGRLTFLNDVFGERGAKAINALLSDYDKFDLTLQQIKVNADGFTNSVVAALKTTTQGSLKSLFNEFQLASEEAFNSAKTGIDLLINSLRNLVVTEEFKSGLKTITEVATTLLRVLSDNIDVAITLAKTWLGLKLVTLALGSGLAGMAAAAMGATGAVSGLAVGMGILSRSMGWISLLIGGIALLVEYTSKNREVNEAVRARAEEQAIETRAIEQSNEQIDKRLLRLEEERRLILAGVDAVKARIEAEGNLARTMSTQKATDSAGKYAAAYEKYWSSPENRDAESFRNLQSLKFQAEQDARNLAITEAGIAKAKSERETVTMNEALARLVKYNKRAADINAKMKKDLLPTFTKEMADQLASKSNPEAIDQMVSGLNDNLNAKIGTYKGVDKRGQSRAESAANRLYNAELEAELNARKRLQDSLRDQYEFQKKLDDLKYSQGKYGPYLQQIIDEAAADEYYTKAIKGVTDGIEGLNRVKAEALKNNKPWGEADEVKYQDALKSAANDKEQFERKQKQDRQLAAARTGLTDEKLGDNQRDALAEIASGAEKYIAKLREMNAVKVQDPITAAASKAKFDVIEQNRSGLLKLEEEINQALVGRDVLAERVLTSSEEDLQKNMQSYDAASKYVSVLREMLRIRKETVETKAEEAGGVAATETARARLPETGVSRFWAEFVAQGESSADIIYKTMKTSTDKMADAFVTFATTGKISFSGLARSIIADLIRIQAQQAFRALLMNIVGGSPSFAGGTGTVSGGSSVGNMPQYGGATYGGSFALGGIMTPNGPLPLRKYRNGGVAHSPQVAIFAEADKAEAYVPLPDGRSIPVSMKGGGSGGTTVYLTHSPTINIDSRSDAAQVHQIAQRAATQSNKELMQTLKDEGYLG